MISEEPFFALLVSQCVKLVAEVQISKFYDHDELEYFDRADWLQIIEEINRCKEVKATLEVLILDGDRMKAVIKIKEQFPDKTKQ